MANIEVKLRRGTDTEHSSFTGAEGEVTVDTTNNTLRVHDNSTAGGIRLAKLSEAGLSAIANLSVLGNVSGASAVPVAVDIKDEDAMTSDSATALATQQSIKAYVDSNAGIPTGTVTAFAGSTAPTGYVLCDGSEYSETTESALFAVISTTYNTGGETANHFRVPDLRGRVVAGLDSANNVLNETTSIDGTALGEFGGDDVHTLTIAQMPAHDHGGANSQVSDPAGTNLTIGTTGSFDFVSLPSEGGGQAHNNVQPTIILNYIIKT